MKDWLNDTTYKGVIIEGSTFEGSPYRYDLKVTFTNETLNEYIPTLKKMLPNISKGMYLMMLTHTRVEGFFKGSTSYKTNNPGNVGNTDNGKRVPFATLEDGIMAQYNFLKAVAEGKRKSYPLGKKVEFASYYSKEIAKNTKKYQKSPWVPGYRFVYTGQLDQYLKIYATGPRSGNIYINFFLTIFKNNGITITPESKIQDIINL